MKSKDPLVSVYITNYNYERFIRDSIESVLAQSLQDLELIIIDDGSKDGSRAIIEEYRDQTGITIIYQQNKGLNITNNVAMRVAKGKYLMRLDADDYLVPDALEKMVAPLEVDDNLGLVFPDYYYVDAEGNITGEERRHNFEKEVSLFDQPAHGACTIIRLDFLKRIGGYNESFTCQDGYDLWLKFIIHYSVKNVNQPLFYYRQHGANLTTNEERILETRRAIKRTFLDLKNSAGSCLAVVPVRHKRIKSQSIPLFDQGDQTFLSNKVEGLKAAHTISKVFVISEDEEILEYARNRFAGDEDVVVLQRSGKLASPNHTLGRTVELATKYAQEQDWSFDYVMTAAPDYPFVDSEIYDDAVNTVQLFQSDSVLSVRPDNKAYYRHTGHTLQPILDQDKFTRIEREALYKAAGGVVVATRSSFEKHGRINAGKMSHIVVDERAAFGVFSEFDFRVFKSMLLQTV